MIAAADTSPINYLVLIEATDLLPYLFGRVLIPSAVHRELQHLKASSSVRHWSAHLPHWAEVDDTALTADVSLLHLGDGERETIQLALELNISTVLIDETEGRRIAVARNLEVRGTLGILERGAKRGLIDLRAALAKLQSTNFRISPNVYEALLRRNPEE